MTFVGIVCGFVRLRGKLVCRQSGDVEAVQGDASRDERDIQHGVIEDGLWLLTCSRGDPI